VTDQDWKDCDYIIDHSDIASVPLLGCERPDDSIHDCTCKRCPAFEGFEENDTNRSS
jgi:hypothetical protein